MWLQLRHVGYGFGFKPRTDPSVRRRGSCDDGLSESSAVETSSNPGDEPSRAQALGAGWQPHQCFSAWSIAGRAASSMT